MAKKDRTGVNMTQSSARTRFGKLAISALLAATLGLAGCGAIIAQNPDKGYGPVNAVAMDDSKRVMLKGADVVAYITQNAYVQGSKEFAVKFGDIDFYFANSVNRALFQSDPEKYLPQYGGYCANGIMFGIPWGGDADSFIIHNGKVYNFGGPGSRAVFALNLEQNIALADKYWAEEIAGSNSFVQRFKRLVFRVPHYQTTDEQMKLLKAANGR